METCISHVYVVLFFRYASGKLIARIIANFLLLILIFLNSVVLTLVSLDLGQFKFTFFAKKYSKSIL